MLKVRNMELLEPTVPVCVTSKGSLSAQFLKEGLKPTLS